MARRLHSAADAFAHLTVNVQGAHIVALRLRGIDSARRTRIATLGIVQRLRFALVAFLFRVATPLAGAIN